MVVKLNLVTKVMAAGHMMLCVPLFVSSYQISLSQISAFIISALISTFSWCVPYLLPTKT